MHSPKMSLFLFTCGIAAFLAACEEEHPATPAVPSATATMAPAAVPTPAPTVEKKSNERPERVETTLTPERRASVEAKFAAAKGFLVATELETALKKNKALKDKKTAIAAFDKAAKGKWVLFTGPLVNLTDTGFDVGITYTPQLENDPIGMSRQFFEVTLGEIEGYAKDRFKPGNIVVVVAKYTGAGKAGPGHELIAADVWK